MATFSELSGMAGHIAVGVGVDVPAVLVDDETVLIVPFSWVDELS